jgi:hypothetical protein
MPIAVNEIVQVTYRGRSAGQRILMMSTWKCISNASANDMLTDLNSVITAMTAAGSGSFMNVYLKCLGSDYTLEACRAQIIHPARQIYMEAPIAGVVGLGTAASNTANLTGVVTRVSAAAGRSGVSNTHLGPVPSNVFSNGLFTGAGLTLLEAFGAKWITNMATGVPVINFKPVIFHRNNPTIPSTDILTYRVGLEVRDMTRRVVGRGE